jgi:hypothetical protein
MQIYLYSFYFNIQMLRAKTLHLNAIIKLNVDVVFFFIRSSDLRFFFFSAVSRPWKL